MKEQNKVLRGIGIALSILLVVASFYLLYQLIKINVLPTKLLFLIHEQSSNFSYSKSPT